MGSLALLIFSFLATLLLATAQFDNNLMMGKPCDSSFHCWRTEPIDSDGQPVSLNVQQRGKRLEIGGSLSRGGRCRCVEGVCRLFHIQSESFFACEEF